VALDAIPNLMSSTPGCDSVANFTFEDILVPGFGNDTLAACGPNYYLFLDSILLDTSQITTFILDGAASNGCDSNLILQFCFLNPQVQLDSVNPIGCGAESCRFIDASATDLTPDSLCYPSASYSISWTASNGGQISSQANDTTRIRVCTPGDYEMTLTQSAFG